MFGATELSLVSMMLRGEISGASFISSLARALMVVLVCYVCSVSSGDFFDDADLKDFGGMSKNGRQGLSQNWEERCREVGGKEVLDNYVAEQEQLLFCVMEQFNVVQIQREVEEKKKVGELDEVFKKYCRNHISAVRGCLKNFLDVSRLCLRPQERPGLNVSLNMVDSAIRFVCHNSGDRIALFMSYDGVQCMVEHKEEIMSCINRSVPEMYGAKKNMRTSKMHFYVFQKENCRKGDAIIRCVEASLMKCPDPTPANLVHGLLQAMKQETPCASEGWSASGQQLPLVAGIALANLLWRL